MFHFSPRTSPNHLNNSMLHALPEQYLMWFPLFSLIYSKVPGYFFFFFKSRHCKGENITDYLKIETSYSKFGTDDNNLISTLPYIPLSLHVLKIIIILLLLYKLNNLSFHIIILPPIFQHFHYFHFPLYSLVNGSKYV